MNEEILKNKILNNEIVSIQTETVYGLFAKINLNNKSKINLLKGRNKDQSLQVSFGNFEQIFDWTELSDFQREQLINNLPGDTSFVVPLKKEKINELGKETILVRFPKMNDDHILIKLLNSIGPLFSTSANIHGEPEFSNCDEIEQKMNISCYEVKSFLIKNKPSRITSLLNDKIKVIRK